MIVSIGALGFTTYHTRLAQEEYYSPDKYGERPGQFVGQGAQPVHAPESSKAGRPAGNSLISRKLDSKQAGCVAAKDQLQMLVRQV